MTGCADRTARLWNLSGEELAVLRGEVLADHRHQPDAGKKTGRGGKIGRGAAQDLVPLTEGGLHRVERHRTDNQNVH